MKIVLELNLQFYEWSAALLEVKLTKFIRETFTNENFPENAHAHGRQKHTREGIFVLALTLES